MRAVKGLSDLYFELYEEQKASPEKAVDRATIKKNGKKQRRPKQIKRN